MSKDNLGDLVDRCPSPVGAEILDKLLNDISIAEKELDSLKEQIRNQGELVRGEGDGVQLEARTLQEELKIIKKTDPEGFEDDEQIQYFLAVGQIEEQGLELRKLKEMYDNNIVANGKTIKALHQYIEEQTELNKSLAEELAKADKMEDDQDDDEQTSTAKRKVEADIRLTRKILKELKLFLKDFIEKTAKLDPNYQVEEGASIGYLLQALWSSFLQGGTHRDYIHVEDLQYDVHDKDLQQLATAGILQTHPKDPKKIRMVDFTMRN